jgi:ATP-dependent protease HslVU (ClpYQ) ATPase subunit
MQAETEADQEARARAVRELLDSWINCSEEEAQEQLETLAVLRQAFDFGEVEEMTVEVDEEQRIKRAIELLDSLLEGDPEEQRETGEYLRKALDEDRLSYRKLFPDS